MWKSIVTALALALPSALHAHEFWIEPLAYQVAEGEEIEAHLRVGEGFAGSTFSFNPRNFQRFDYAQGRDVAPVPGRAGDRPAVAFAAPGSGLVILSHETNAMRLTYTSMDKFEAFITHKDWPELRQAHRARGLSEERFQERYTRHVKSLVAVGDGVGADRVIGLRTEIVALSNPYTDPSDTLPVQVWLEGEPRTESQVELFEKAPDGTVLVSLHRTDARGIVDLPVRSGHSYLADAVVIRALEPSTTEPEVWESLWAGLTFAVP